MSFIFQVSKKQTKKSVSNIFKNSLYCIKPILYCKDVRPIFVKIYNLLKKYNIKFIFILSFLI